MVGVPSVRWAGAADAAELTRLRAVMFEAMGVDTDVAGWREAADTWWPEALARGEAFAGVVDDPEVPGRLAACGVGLLHRRIPAPRVPDGRWGHIQSMVTDARWRRRGLARAVLGSLLEEFERRGVSVVELQFTSEGEQLYREAGFTPPRNPYLARRVLR